jgi:hypothetical protein
MYYCTWMVIAIMFSGDGYVEAAKTEEVALSFHP